MNLKAKLVGDENERAVSPVIGVILMVAITVILAAVIAAFVIDLGQSTGASAQAGVTFDGNETSVDITINSIERADTIEYRGGDSGDWTEIGSSEVGDVATGVTASDGVYVRATYDGNTNVIATHNT